MNVDAEGAATVRRAVMHLGRRLRAERPPGALSGNKLVVLSHLYRHGPSTPGTIAAAERQQPQSLTRTFNELRLAGLIDRRPSEHDRRESVLTITDAGRGALVRDMADRDDWLAGAMDVLTEAEAEMLRIAAGLMERLAARPGLTRGEDGPAHHRPAPAPAPAPRPADTAHQQDAAHHREARHHRDDEEISA